MINLSLNLVNNTIILVFMPLPQASSTVSGPQLLKRSIFMVNSIILIKTNINQRRTMMASGKSLSTTMKMAILKLNMVLVLKFLLLKTMKKNSKEIQSIVLFYNSIQTQKSLIQCSGTPPKNLILYHPSLRSPDLLLFMN